MDNLKPCPFCGAKETDDDEPIHVWFSPTTDSFSVECDRCHASIVVTGEDVDEDDAIKAWNRRATDG